MGCFWQWAVFGIGLLSDWGLLVVIAKTFKL